MSFNINSLEDKVTRARNLSKVISPDLGKMIEIIIDEKTKAYVPKGTTKAKIKAIKLKHENREARFKVAKSERSDFL